jgi:precorrin-6Y C5,15-methyltransferase (decarboxylating)
LKITIIGIYDQIPVFTPEELENINTCSHFAGGKRHYELVKEALPSKHTWVNITVPLQTLFDEIKNTPGPWVVFASGDPWFFGIANTLKREFPQAGINVYSVFNALQLLGQHFGINYGEYKIVTLTGRPWKAFDKALIEGESKLALLTDRKKTPASIAERMLRHGYSNYTMLYGEHMGGAGEKTCRLMLDEALALDFGHPNSLFLQKTNHKIPRKLIPEADFIHLENRPKMITKMPVRISTLAAMDLGAKNVFWDIGTCTGSVAIEAKLNFPHLDVMAFELHPERLDIMKENCQKMQAPGIETFEGDYLGVDKQNLPAPDAIFLGGYGGKMEAILDDASNRLKGNGILAFNSVSETSRQRFLDWAKANSYLIVYNQRIQVAPHNPIHIITIQKNTH